MLESGLDILIDVKVIDYALDHLAELGMMLLSSLAILNMKKNDTFH